MLTISKYLNRYTYCYGENGFIIAIIFNRIETKNNTIYHLKDKLANLSTMKIGKKVLSWGLKLVAAELHNYSNHYAAGTIVSRLLCPMLILKQITFYGIIKYVSLLTNKTPQDCMKTKTLEQGRFFSSVTTKLTVNVYISYRLCEYRMFLIIENLKFLSSILSEKRRHKTHEI